MSLRRLAVLAVLLAATGCVSDKVVLVDDEVPLATPLDAELAGDVLGPEPDDPPVRVVRLNYTEGEVSRQPAGVDDWAPAPVNLPLATGDNLWVPPGGRAELHAGATDLRLAQASGLEVLHLDNRSVQLGLPRGSMELRILPGPDLDSVEVDTPNGAVVMDRAGDYRVDVDPAGAADQVTVRSGLAEVTAAGVTVPVNPGNTLDLAGGDRPSYDLGEARPQDGFDQWCAARDRREDGSESAVYLGRGVTGYEDLDGQGTWQIDPVNGTAWQPRVAAGWAPYRDGRWAWSEPYGWTWVDDAPWGFATSHYGRWEHSDHGWVWIPHAEGMRMARPVYAPALVAFVGGPGLHGGAAAGGGVAWFPLGPREPYLPAYPASRSYVAGLNAADLPHGTPVRAVAYANQSVPGAVTLVPQSVFLGARPVAAAALPVRALGQGLRAGSAPALVPGRASVLAAAGPASRPPFWYAARPLQVRNHMPLAAVPFEARQQALAAGHGRPLAAPAVTGLRRADPAARAIPTRLATSPGPGGNLRPVRPGLAPSQPSRPAFTPPARPFHPGMAIQSEGPGNAEGGRNPGQQRMQPPSQRPGRPMGPNGQNRPPRPMGANGQNRPEGQVGPEGQRPRGPNGQKGLNRPRAPRPARRAAPARPGGVERKREPR